MSSIVQKLTNRRLIAPPYFVPYNTMYETVTGSEAYGISTEGSDKDIYGWCIPPKDVLFPHLAGEIPGFGKQKKKFDQYQQHGILDPGTEVVYDVAIYNIVKYFQLCMENNPNMLDSLFTPRRCVLHSTAVSEMLRERRRDFLHKGSWPKHKGYAYSQLHKMRSTNRTGRRKEIFDKYGFDVKFATHVVRLLYQAEMILTERDLDLERHKEHLKEIRRGNVPQEEIENWAREKEKYLERVYEESKIPWGPDEEKIKELLLNCLEHHYGNLTGAIVVGARIERAVDDVFEAAHKLKTLLST